MGWVYKFSASSAGHRTKRRSTASLSAQRKTYCEHVHSRHRYSRDDRVKGARATIIRRGSAKSTLEVRAECDLAHTSPGERQREMVLIGILLRMQTRAIEKLDVFVFVLGYLYMNASH